MRAFKTLQDALASTATLYPPKDGRRYHLFVDASDFAIGAALFQEQESGRVPMGYYSKKLSDVQTSWAATDRELFAVYWALTTTASLTLGAPITVHTDHSALCHLDTSPTPKLMRYGLAIRAFRADIHHVRGKDNVLADFLSRLDATEVDADVKDGYVLFSVSDAVHITLEKLSEACEKEEKPTGVEQRDGVFYFKHSTKLYIPKVFREQLLYLAHVHQGGHIGVGKVIKVLTRKVWWPALASEAAAFVARCLVCQCLRAKPSQQGHGKLDRLKFNELISIDYIGPRIIKERSYWILVVIDHYCRFAAGTVTTEPDARTAVNFLRRRWIPMLGHPSLVLTDNSPFGQAFSDELKSLRMQHIKSLPYHPEGNGMNEAAHRLLEHAIKTHVVEPLKTLEDIVQQAFLVHNAVPHVATGESPFYLLTGEDPVLPGWNLITRRKPEEERLIDLREDRFYQNVLYRINLQRVLAARPPSKFKAGDIVIYQFRQQPELRPLQHRLGVSKWAPNWSLPCRILAFTSREAVKLKQLWSEDQTVLVRPLSEIRLISRRIPAYMRDIYRRILKPRKVEAPSEPEAKRARQDEVEETPTEPAPTSFQGGEPVVIEDPRPL